MASTHIIALTRRAQRLWPAAMVLAGLAGSASATLMAAHAVHAATVECFRHAGLDCNCPGCRAYLDACEQPCPDYALPPHAEDQQAMPQPSAPDGEQEAPAPEAETADEEPFAGPMPSLSAGLGALAASASATPGMIGDLFGATSGQSLITLDRVFVIASDIDALTPGASGSPFTASESPSSVAVAEGFTTSGNAILPTGVIRIEPATAQFTTVATTADLAQTLATNPQASIPIVDDAAYRQLAASDLAARNGVGGQTEFNPDSAVSFARMQDGSLPSGGPGAGEDYDAAYAYDYVVLIPFDSLGGAPGANVGRQKITENGSSIPRDRIINNFSFFRNTPLSSAGHDVVRNVSGFEKTFFDEMTSVELRVPYASTLDSTVAVDSTGIVGGTNGELGNMTVYAKLLLLERQRFALGAGLGVAVPTANDFVIQDAHGVDVLRVESESTHLLPYVGYVWTPNSDWFCQGFLQFDVDTQGNSVAVSSFDDGAYTGQLVSAGRLRDKDLIYVDLALGYWMYQNPRGGFLTGLAPVMEVHYNGSIDAGDPLTTSTFRTVSDSSFDVVNAVAGAVVQFGGDLNLMLGYATPLGGDEQYDGEFRMNLNWFFGPSAQRNARRPY
ncbi:MAG: hypothetical protein DCC67_02960 [Planctomycetota bacterium]|nr:MAG: hypothetical protein DCC67_02960 [Planctomycetota bacterium]